MPNRLLLSLTPLTLCILMGCPPAQNNDVPEPEDMTSGKQDMPTDQVDMSDTKEDMPVDEDMSEDMHIEEDMPDAKEDMPGDMGPVDVEPPVLLRKPVSSPTKTATPLTFVLSSKKALPRNRWTHVVVANGRRRLLENGELDFDCAGEADEFICNTTLAPQSPPEGEEAWPTGVHTLTLSNEDGSDTFDIPMHVHLPWEEIKKQDAQPTSLPLPANYARCGVDAKVKALDVGPGVFSVMLNETGDQVTLDLSADGLSDPTAAESVSIVSEDILAHDFEVVRDPIGGFSAAWWAYDDTNHTFCGVTDHFKSTGVSEGRGDSFCVASPFPLARIIDAQWSLQQEATGGYSASARIMAITEHNTWVSLRLFGATQQVELESDQEDLFIGLPASEISNKNTGFLYSNPADVGPEGPTKVWQIGPRDPEADGTPQTGARLTVLSFTDAGQGAASLDLPATFEVKDSYVGHSNTGKIFVLLLGEQAEQILYETELNASNDLLTPPVEKKLPANVGIERRRQQALDRRRREARLKRQVRKTRQGFAPHRIELISAGGQTTALGRWPWNWRDRLKSNAITHPTQDVITGPIEVSGGSADEVQLSVSWVDGESDLKLVAPLTSQFEAPGDPPKDIKGSQGALCMSGDGNRVEPQSTAFDPAFCELDEDACRIRIDGFDGGHSLVVGPGQTGVTVSTSLYGEILISGDPIEFDEDRFYDPTPVNNALHISYQDNLIFEEPFEGPPPLETSIMMARTDSSDSGATHGVWVRNWQTGKLSGPGEVRFDTGVQAIIDGRTSIQSLTFSGGSGTSDVAITAVIEVTYAGADAQASFGQPERYIVQIPNDKLVESVHSDQVTVIDLNARPPLKQEPVTLDPYAIASPPTLLSPPLAGRNLAPGALPGEEVIDLTEEQSRAPMLVSTSGEGCGSFKIQSVGTDAEGMTTLTTIDEHIPAEADCADQEILLGTGDFTGNGDDTEMLSLNRVHRRLRIRRRIRKRISGTAERPGLGIASTDTDIPAEIALGDLEATLSTTIDDFNGDFIDDVAITTGATPDQPSSTLILFGDGTGGFLPETAQAKAPPVKRGITETAGEVCVGVHNGNTNTWECEDDALDTHDDNLYCGETDHF